MIPQLPLDVLIKILSFLPASRARFDDGSLTLAHFLQSSNLLREAAFVPSIWESHYEMRYEYCDEGKEEARREAAGNNWRKLYFQRRQLDCLALQYLDKIVMERIGRQETAGALFRLSMDVWDVLELESQCPVPELFADRADRFIRLRIPYHAITRRHWAKSMLDTISRGHAIDIWRPFWVVPSPSKKPPFELTMSSLSCFFGQSEKRITAQFDDLATRCSEELIQNKVRLELQGGNDGVPAICRGICSFMKSQGFSTFPGPWDSNVMNNFPHAYLTTNKQTLPICLVHIFTAIATRLGLNASPINFPGTVLAHVLRHEGDEPIIVNTSVTHPMNAVLNSQNPPPMATHLPGLALALSTTTQSLQPCTGVLMLLRASRNILSSLMSIPDVPPSVFHPSLLLSICVHLLFQADDDTLDRLLSNIYLKALDCILLLDCLAPSLVERCQTMVRFRCQAVLHAEAVAAFNIHNRAGKLIKYFVGMAFVHARYKYVGFIYGWDVNCDASEDWMGHMTIDSLPRGRNQPFYNVFSDNGSKRYVAEENIWPAAFTREHVQAVFRKFDEFSVYFDGGVDLPSAPDRGVCYVGARGRLHMSPQTRYAYPDDEDVALRWVEQGIFPV
ncbi:hypothetical protein BYT27DRAFT_7139292 [Phlegmacium glaucopus]|nr:hypothetical protein BYT27DRAFT_7139292 [Phlegmacium glaucopus]